MKLDLTNIPAPPVKDDPFQRELKRLAKRANAAATVIKAIEASISRPEYKALLEQSGHYNEILDVLNGGSTTVVALRNGQIKKWPGARGADKALDAVFAWGQVVAPRPERSGR